MSDWGVTICVGENAHGRTVAAVDLGDATAQANALAEQLGGYVVSVASVDPLGEPPALRAPDGSWWRLTVTVDGTIQPEPIDPEEEP